MNVCPYTDVESDASEMSKCKIQKDNWDTEIVKELPTAYEYLKENIHKNS